MPHRLIFAIAALLPASAAIAQPVPTAPPFATAPVTDRMLDDVRGTAASYTLLTRGNLNRIADAQSRSDFRVQGSIPVLQMDNWWGSVGSELIANAVRNGM